MQTITGDLIQLALAGRFDVIVHGCNCQCAMGAGIARAVRDNFPEAFQADQQTAKGDRAKLGTYSCAAVVRNGHRTTIVNAYTQFHWRGNGVLVDYDALRRVFRAIGQDFAGARIAYPMIGAGMARGDWGLIAGIIETELAGQDHTLVEYRPTVSK